MKTGKTLTQTDIHSINHVGIVVRDMVATSKRYEQMGFTLTPFSPHSGAWKPGEAVSRLGSGNRCVMFANNYLEVLANEDSEQPSARLEGYLKHHQGGHIICLGSEDLPSVEKRLLVNGLKTSGVLPVPFVPTRPLWPWPQPYCVAEAPKLRVRLLWPNPKLQPP